MLLCSKCLVVLKDFLWMLGPSWQCIFDFFVERGRIEGHNPNYTNPTIPSENFILRVDFFSLSLLLLIKRRGSRLYYATCCLCICLLTHWADDMLLLFGLISLDRGFDGIESLYHWCFCSVKHSRCLCCDGSLCDKCELMWLAVLCIRLDSIDVLTLRSGLKFLKAIPLMDLPP